MENKELYILLGEIKQQQEYQNKTHDQQTRTIEEMNKRMAKMESRINYAIGIVTTVIFFFQAGLTYITKMGKA